MMRPMDTPKCYLSVVVPLLNEQESLPKFYEKLSGVLDAYDKPGEMLFIDDGSTDESFEILRGFHRDDPRVRVIRFRKNFGQTAAMSAGFRHARGEVVVPLDADLQNDPEDIPRLVSKLEEGYDVVSGWRRHRHDNAATRLLPSWIANKIISRVTGVAIHDFGCTLKAYRKDLLDETRLYGEMHRFIPAVASWHGARITEMEVTHHARQAGTSKYGLGRTLKVVLDLMTVKFLGAYSSKPIYVFGGLGMFCGFLSLVLGIIVLIQRFAYNWSMNRNALFFVTVLLIMATIQFVLMGLLAEILVRTYHESQDRPTYVVREMLDGSDSSGDDDEQLGAEEQGAPSSEA